MLVDHEIKELINSGHLQVFPFDPELINPCSLDIRLGTEFAKITTILRRNVDVRKIANVDTAFACEFIDPLNIKETVKETRFSIKIGDKDPNLNKFWLPPGQMVLASTLETFSLKTNRSIASVLDKGIASMVKGKSSLGRLGLLVGQHAGWIDPGYGTKEGPAVITLQIKNDSKKPIVLTSGMKIAQLVLYRTSAPEDDYSVKGRYTGKGLEASKGV